MYYNIFETPEGRRFRSRVLCRTREQADRFAEPLPGERARRVAVVSDSGPGILRYLFAEWRSGWPARRR